jgi:hypothetical protein
VLYPTTLTCTRAKSAQRKEVWESILHCLLTNWIARLTRRLLGSRNVTRVSGLPPQEFPLPTRSGLRRQGSAPEELQATAETAFAPLHRAATHASQSPTRDVEDVAGSRGTVHDPRTLIGKLLAAASGNPLPVTPPGTATGSPRRDPRALRQARSKEVATAITSTRGPKWGVRSMPV